MEAQQQRDQIVAALGRLNPDQRAALVLVDMQGYSVEEAAAILGCAPGTVKSRCARGRARLAAPARRTAQAGGGGLMAHPLELSYNWRTPALFATVGAFICLGALIRGRVQRLAGRGGGRGAGSGRSSSACSTRGPGPTCWSTGTG